MQVYVWENVLKNHAAGFAVAIAQDADQARALIKGQLDGWLYDLTEFDSPPTHVYPIDEARVWLAHGSE